jgi:hypothetical protein
MVASLPQGPRHFSNCSLNIDEGFTMTVQGLARLAYAPRRRPSSVRLAKFGGSPKLGGNESLLNHVNIYLGGVAAMFAMLAFFLIAILLMLGVIADSLWGRFQRR